jgi:toxin ParE1/3/4
MTVRWTPTALRDLQALHASIADDRDSAAIPKVDRILEAISALEDFPEIGRRGRVAGTRELVVPPYVVVYRLRRGVIELLGIIHGKRRWPERF